MIPAIPLIVIRPFLPESPVWAAKKTAGTLKRPQHRGTLRPAFRRDDDRDDDHVRLQLRRRVRRDPANAANRRPVYRGDSEDEGQAEAPVRLKSYGRPPAEYGEFQEIGGLVGRFLLAMLAVRILSRRVLLRIFQIPGLLLMPAIFWAFATQPNSSLFHLGSMDITWMHLGFSSAACARWPQFSFWGNYLPYVYPVHLRGTGESFAANIGGRLIGTSFAAVTSFIATAPWVPGGIPPAKFAYTAAGWPCSSIWSARSPVLAAGAEDDGFHVGVRVEGPNSAGNGDATGIYSSPDMILR